MNMPDFCGLRGTSHDRVWGLGFRGSGSRSARCMGVSTTGITLGPPRFWKPLVLRIAVIWANPCGIELHMT